MNILGLGLQQENIIAGYPVLFYMKVIYDETKAMTLTRARSVAISLDFTVQNTVCFESLTIGSASELSDLRIDALPSRLYNHT